MDSDKLGRHIGLMHGEKATKKQQEKAKQARAKKWWCCDVCLATMNEKHKARHLKVCTGRAVEVSTRKTGVRKLVPRGPKALKNLEILGFNFLMPTKVEAKFEANARTTTSEMLQRKWQRNYGENELLEKATVDGRQEASEQSHEELSDGSDREDPVEQLEGEAAARQLQIQRMRVSNFLITSILL